MPTLCKETTVDEVAVIASTVVVDRAGQRQHSDEGGGVVVLVGRALSYRKGVTYDAETEYFDKKEKTCKGERTKEGRTVRV